MSNSVPIEELAKIWLSQDRDAETRATIQGLLDLDHKTELEKRLRHRMAFGTAGLRASMDAGYAHMNALTILQTSQGLAKYIKSVFTEQQDNLGVVIGFDGRRNSARFARLTATVLLNAGFKRVYLFPNIVPTPYVPFTVRKFNLHAGVMVTASHNPMNDNGYKVYWNTGAQIISPHDSGIAAAIEESLDVASEQWDDSKVLSRTIDATEEVTKDFFESMKSVLLNEKKEPSSGSNTPIVYTAMHGVGTVFALRAMKQVAGMTSVSPVLEQCFPDPYFRTVEFPNPEEGKSSLNLAIKTANLNNANIILANDPDADRLAAAERLSSDPKSFKIFSGNEIGALLGWWQVFKAKKAGKRPDSLAMLSSTVSSGILNSIAKKEGMYFEETLTGFKFMGTRTKELEEDNKFPQGVVHNNNEKKNLEVIFAFEEAIGFMCGSRVRDKDGVTAAAVMCDMIQYFVSQNKEGWSLQQQLNEIYAEYGLHLSHNSYVVSKDPAKTNEMFESFRNGGKYIESVGGSKVLAVRDLVTGYDSSRPDKKALLPLSKSSPMITCELENGVRFTVRASGTEPKVKFYTEIVSPSYITGKSAAEREKIWEESNKILEDTVKAIVDEIMKPEHFGFARRSG